MVYECDILTQLTQEGFDKILLLRKSDSDNLGEDRKVAKEKNIPIEQARLILVIESAKKSFNFIKPGSEIKKYADSLWRDIQKKYKARASKEI